MFANRVTSYIVRPSCSFKWWYIYSFHIFLLVSCALRWVFSGGCFVPTCTLVYKYRVQQHIIIDKCLWVEILHTRLLSVNEKVFDILNFKTFPCDICNFHLLQEWSVPMKLTSLFSLLRMRKLQIHSDINGEKQSSDNFKKTICSGLSHISTGGDVCWRTLLICPCPIIGNLRDFTSLSVTHLTSGIDSDHLNALIKTLFAWVVGLCIEIPLMQQTPRYLLYHEINPSFTSTWAILGLPWIHSENDKLQH